MSSPAFTPPLPLPFHARISTASNSTRRTTIALAKRTRRVENTPGDFYVDTTCIDCDTCRWMAPEIFNRKGHMSAVHSQPETAELELRALQAALACPTGSIHTEKPSRRIKEAAACFPLPAVNNVTQMAVPDVYYNGFASPSTFGGASWLLLNRGKQPYAVMFDCPRYNSSLAKQIKEVTAEVGGVRYLVLSHRDDVAGHDRWANAFGAERVIHDSECNREQKTDECEVKLSDSDFPYELAEGAQLIHVPGHTMGSIAMLHRPTKSLFTGDHIMFRISSGMVTGGMYSRSLNRQIESVEKLRDVPFLHGWPGHGRHFHYENDEERRRGIAGAAAHMRNTYNIK